MVILFNIYRLLGNLGKGMVFESDRKKRLRAIIFGFYDGLRGKLGKCTIEHLF